ncbi:MAG: cupin domain-containing protein [Steroidobacteraceae bacterium]|jgi:redox-sensitive bicupin YhaK (pirin superfamily)|nr:cupin domain-containing protein [Steroidobacteraceae bacterium]
MNATTATAAASTHLRIRPTEHGWEQFPDPHGRPTTPVRILKLDDPYVLEADFPPHFHAGLHWHPHDTIYVITAGEMRFGDEGVFRPGDIRWVRGGHAYGPETAGPAGVRFHLVSLGGPVGLNWADLYEVPATIATRLAGFEQVAGRVTIADDFTRWPRTAPVPGVRAEVLCEDHPPLLRLVLDAGASLPAHAFGADALAYVRGGSLAIEGEAPLEAGDLRWSRADATAGRATAGAGGADLVFIGLSGALDWRTAE